MVTAAIGGLNTGICDLNPHEVMDTGRGFLMRFLLILTPKCDSSPKELVDFELLPIGLELLTTGLELLPTGLELFPSGSNCLPLV